MTDVRAAYDPNRLPWLSDTDGARAARRTAPRRPPHWSAVALWGVIALLLVAAVGYWAGMRSVEQIEAAANQDVAASEVTAVLPEPLPQAPAPPQVEPAPQQDLQPVAPPAMVRMNRAQPVEPVRQEQSLEQPDPAPSAEAEPASEESTAAAISAAPAAQVQAPRPVAKPAPLTLWPADVSQGAAGRVVRIGTFSSRLAAKRAWSRIVRIYPGMKRLKAVVAPVPSARNGRTYYRLQFGTTSQAHSAVLCQRMRIVGQSCVVVGTPAR